MLKRPLNGSQGAVVLDLLAAHDHRSIRRYRDTGGDGEGGVWDPTDDVVVDGGRDCGDEALGDSAEEGRV